MPTRVLRAALIVLVAAAVAPVALAGCAARTPDELPRGTAAAASPASPAPTPSPSPTLVAAPTRVFGGSCGSVFSNGVVASTLGTPASLQPPSYSQVYSFAPLDFGGIACRWSAQGAGDHKASISLTVLSASAGVPTASDSVYCYGDTTKSAGSQGTCSFETTASGYWASGILSTAAATTNATARSAVAGLTAAFAKSAAGAGTPVDPAAVTGAWAHSASCAGLSTASRVTAAISSPSLVVGNADLEPGELPAGYASSLRAAGAYACDWHQKSSITPRGQVTDFGLQVFPGGARTQTLLPAFPQQAGVEVKGADSAFTFADPEGWVDLTVFAGSNVVQLLFDRSTPTSTMTAAAEALLATLQAGRSA